MAPFPDAGQRPNIVAGVLALYLQISGVAAARVSFGSVAAAGEVRVLLLGRLERTARLTRHRWRMCASCFIASGSLFFGQPQVFPAWFNASPVPALLAFAPILVMMGWWLFCGSAES